MNGGEVQKWTASLWRTCCRFLARAMETVMERGLARGSCHPMCSVANLNEEKSVGYNQNLFWV